METWAANARLWLTRSRTLAYTPGAALGEGPAAGRHVGGELVGLPRGVLLGGLVLFGSAVDVQKRRCAFHVDLLVRFPRWRKFTTRRRSF